MVRRIADGLQPIIGLQAVPEGERYNEPNQIDDVSTASSRYRNNITYSEYLIWKTYR